MTESSGWFGANADARGYSKIRGMFPRFTDVILAIDDLVRRGLIENYAVFGSIAQMFWDEAIPTFDLDVLILLKGQQGRLVDLGPLYAWADERGFPLRNEHIVIGEIPVQFLPAPSQLHEEAVRNAATLDYEGTPIRVVRPEYLIATWLTPPANNATRRERAARLKESEEINPEFLDGLLQKYGLSW